MLRAVRRPPWLGLFGFALFAYLYAFPYFGALRHANELPRVLTTQEIVHHGTFRLDGRLAELGSRADISTTPDGHAYQNKAPGLSIFGAVVYAPVAAAYALVHAGRPSLAVTTWLLRVFSVVVPAALFWPLFRRLANRFAGGDPLARDLALVATALGSLLFPYGIVFMSHVPAAVVVGGSFALAVEVTRGERAESWRSFGLLGVLFGVALLVEYQSVFAVAPIGLLVLARVKRRGLALAAMAAAAAPFGIVLAAYHKLAFGSPLRTGYAYSVDEANRTGFWGIVGPSSEAAGQLLTLGSNGLLVLSPWVLLAIVGAGSIFSDQERRARLGAEAVVACIVCAVYLAFVASLVPEFGRAGWSVGPRYIAVAIPFFGWLAAAGIARATSRDELIVPVIGAVALSVMVNVVAATTYPHWPIQLSNPLFEVSFRLLRDGRAPHSLGTAVGLRGLASLAPLYVAILAGVVLFVRRAGARIVLVLAGVVLGGLALSRFENVSPTAPALREKMMQFVESTYEP